MAFSKARRLANLMSSASDTVPAAKVNTVIADDAVTSPKIADDAVTTDKLANSINSAITANTAKVTNAITTHTGDVTGAAALTIAANAVTIGKLAVTDGSSGQVLSTNGSGTLSFATISAGAATGTSLPSVTAVGTQFYNTSTKALYSSDGSAWVLIAQANALPIASGGTVTMAPMVQGATFTHNLGLQFNDADSVDSLLTYTLHSGTLPPGLVLPVFGTSAVTGTATHSSTATYNFVIKATDLDGAIGTQAYTQVQTYQVLSTGGTITTPSGFRVHRFTSSGTFNPGTLGLGGGISIAVVAGGGSGGGARHGAGGGAGGMIVLTGQTLANANATVTIGAGGYVNGYNSWGSGSNTVFGSSTAIGGGRAGAQNGGTWTIAAVSGGSGGGQGNPDAVVAGAAGTAGQGNAGGASSTSAPQYGGGAGGGKSAVGGSGSGSSGGVGGAGLAFEGVTYAGGGGGPGWSGGWGAGGAGGGGDAYTGNYSASGSVGSSGATNTGGGGGGSNSIHNNSRGGTGGSGIVVIKVPV